jgi:hypothetical protein
MLCYTILCCAVLCHLQAHYPGSEPFGVGVVRNSSMIDLTSRPNTASGGGSGSTDGNAGYGSSSSAVLMSKRDLMSTSNPVAFRSSAGSMLDGLVESQNTEIRKILFNMFDLIEVTLWTFLANTMHLCDEDVFMDS